MARFVSPVQQFFDANGDPLNGGKLYFYDAGTTSPKDTWSDNGLTVANANPVVLDSAGRAGDVFLESGTYRVILKDSSDVTIWDADPVDGAPGASGAVTTITASTTLVAADATKTILVDTSGGDVTVTLLAAATAGDGYEVTIKKTTADDNIVTVDGNGAETIDGAATAVLVEQYQSVTIRTDGSAWYIRARELAQAIATTNDTATEGPDFDLDRRSASAAANDILAGLRWLGRNDNATPQKVVFAKLLASILTETDGAEDGRWELHTMLAGTLGARLYAAAGLWTPNATSGDQGIDSFNASKIYQDGERIRPVSPQSAQTATGTETELDFTSLPAGINRITVIFDQVSLTGTDNVLVQIGDSGGFETAGYSSVSIMAADDATGGGVSSTSGFVCFAAAAAIAISGAVTLTRINSNIWTISGTYFHTNNQAVMVGGVKSLSAELDRVRITRTGTDTFDGGGIVNIFVE